MKTLSDDDLRRRVRALGRREAAAARPFARIVQARTPAPDIVPASSGTPDWLRGLVAMAGIAAVVVALAGQWSGAPRRGGAPAASVAQGSPDPGVEWALPTDSLLIEAGDGDVETLSREIEGLLHP